MAPPPSRALLERLAFALLGALLAVLALPLLPLHAAPPLTPSTLPPAPLYGAILAVVGHLDALLATLTPPNLLLFRHVMGFVHTAELHAAAKLRVAELLHAGTTGGATGATCVPVRELAARVGEGACARAADSDAAGPASCGAVALRLTRLLRALAAYGVFREAAPAGSDCWANSPLSAFLRGDHPDSMRAVALNFGGVQHRMMLSLDRSLLTGEASFGLEHGGVPFWDFYAAHADEHAVFDATMRQLGRLGGADAAIAADVPWARLAAQLVDVGGGHGEMLAGIVRANPALRRGVVFDMPHVVARARALWAAAAGNASSGGGGSSDKDAAAAAATADAGAFAPPRDAALAARISFVSGDMFAPATLPTPRVLLARAAHGGESAVLAAVKELDGGVSINAASAEAVCDYELPATGLVLRDIVHDWNDEDSVRILASLRAAMRDDTAECYARPSAGGSDGAWAAAAAPSLAPAAAAFRDRVFVVARVIVPGAGFIASVGSNDADMVMLGAFGTTAGERTLAHFERLFEAAGLELVRAHATRSHYQVLEARALPAARSPARPAPQVVAEASGEL